MRIYSVFCLLSSVLFLLPVAPARANGFQVVGLQNTAVRLKNPLDESAFLWMGDRLGIGGSAPEFIRVDDEAALVLLRGEDFPRGALFEFSEFSLISVSDSQIHLWSGRTRIVNGTGADGALLPPPAGSSSVSLKTSFGYFTISRNSVVEAEVGGQRMVFFCLAGEAVFSEAAGLDSVPEKLSKITTGQMLRAAPHVSPDIRRIPPEMQIALESRQFLQLRYTSSGQNPPRLRWFAPRAGTIMDRDKISVLGRVDLSDGPVEVTVAKTPVEVQSSGVFSAQVSLRNMLDSVPVFLKKDNAGGTLALRIVYDLSPPELQIDPVAETTRLRQVLLSGQLNEASVLFCSGKSVPIRNGRFSQLVDLAPGKNRIQVTAFDRAGNRSDAAFPIFREPTSSASSKNLPAPISDTSQDSLPAPPRISKSGWQEMGFAIDFDGPPPEHSQYRIYRSYSGDGPFMTMGETAENSFTDPGPFEPGASFFYRASVIDDIGRESPMTGTVQFSLSTSKPSPPSPITGKMEGSRVRLYWPKDGSGQIGGYNVYRIDGSNTQRVASIPGPPYVADLPETFAELFFRVSAISATSLEESDWSDTVRVTK